MMTETWLYNLSDNIKSVMVSELTELYKEEELATEISKLIGSVEETRRKLRDITTDTIYKFFFSKERFIDMVWQAFARQRIGFPPLLPDRLRALVDRLQVEVVNPKEFFRRFAKEIKPLIKEGIVRKMLWDFGMELFQDESARRQLALVIKEAVADTVPDDIAEGYATTMLTYIDFFRIGKGEVNVLNPEEVIAATRQFCEAGMAGDPKYRNYFNTLFRKAWGALESFLRAKLTNEIYPTAERETDIYFNTIKNELGVFVEEAGTWAAWAQWMADNLPDVVWRLEEALSAAKSDGYYTMYLREALDILEEILSELPYSAEFEYMLRSFDIQIGEIILGITLLLDIGRWAPQEVSSELRAKASERVASAIKEMTFTTPKGTEVTIDYILDQVKKEIRKKVCKGRDAVAFVVTYGSSSHILQGYKKMIEEWLVGKGNALTYFMTRVFTGGQPTRAPKSPQEFAAVYHESVLQNLPASVDIRTRGNIYNAFPILSAWLNTLFFPQVEELLGRRKLISPDEINAWLNLALSCFVAELAVGANRETLLGELNEIIGRVKSVDPQAGATSIYRACMETVSEKYGSWKSPTKIGFLSTLDYWRGRKELVNNLTTVLNRVIQGAVKMERTGYMVYYISTKFEDYMVLGTPKEAHPDSCFWTSAGIRSIPAIITGRNVAVCYAIFVDDEDKLRAIGGTPPTSPHQVTEFYPTSYDAVLSAGKVAGRTLIVVGANGKLMKTEQGNTYTASEFRNEANLIWGALKGILDVKFSNLTFAPTVWYYEAPSP